MILLNLLKKLNNVIRIFIFLIYFIITFMGRQIILKSDGTKKIIFYNIVSYYYFKLLMHILIDAYVIKYGNEKNEKEISDEIQADIIYLLEKYFISNKKNKKVL